MISYYYDLCASVRISYLLTMFLRDSGSSGTFICSSSVYLTRCPQHPTCLRGQTRHVTATVHRALGALIRCSDDDDDDDDDDVMMMMMMMMMM